jgi:hypothetical protein
VGIESLANPNSTLYASQSAYLLNGTASTAYQPYLSLSGTSMSAPVVAGTVALMLQANPSLTPNAIKAVLQYTAQIYSDYDPLTEGAGLLNAKGAVDLARHLRSPSTVPYPEHSTWSEQIVWGNQALSGGRLSADATAWRTDVVWGAPKVDGRHVTFGMQCGNATCTSASMSSKQWRPDRTPVSRNIVWGNLCNGADCSLPWTVDAVSGATIGETVVWGTIDAETVVWGTIDGETVVWGTACSDLNCPSVVWGRK